MYLLTDGRDTVQTPDCVTARFACPYCGQYRLVLDGDDQATHAECFGCGCALQADRPYAQWQDKEEVFIWW